MPTTEEKLRQIATLMDILIGDTSVPKNVRKAMEDAKRLLLGDEELITKTSSAIYAIDEVSNDINLPTHARTQLWSLLSALETIKGE